MHNDATKYVLSIGLCISMLFACTHAEAGKQPKLNPFQNSNAGKGGSLNIPITVKEAIVPEVSQEIIDDIMHEYPDIAIRVKMLQDEEEKDRIPPRTLLLHGKPGCGKTTAAIAIARSLKRKIAYFQSLSLVGDKYQNSGVKRLEKTLEKIVDDINQNPKVKYVVVIDEIMRLVENYKGNRGEARDVATKLWLIIDEFKNSDRVFFVATANEIDDLPEQLETRFSKRNIVEVKMPNQAYRRKVLLNCLNNRHKLTEDQLDELAGYTDGMTQRDIEEIVASADLIDYAKGEKNGIITFDALKEAIGQIKNIGFVSRWICSPIYNWLITPTNNWLVKPTYHHVVEPLVVNPLNYGIVQPFNKFCKKNKETLDNVHKVMVIAGVVRGFMGEDSVKGKPVEKSK